MTLLQPTFRALLRPLPVLLLALAAAAAAADPAADPPSTSSAVSSAIASLRSGAATLSGAALAGNGAIIEGQVLAASDTPVRIDLARAPQTTLVLAPQSRIRLLEQHGACYVLLDQGSLQADVLDKGPYRAIHVIGGSAIVKVTGTLFLVERGPEDADYVALIRGSVQVRLRETVRRALPAASTPELDLSAHQGVVASVRGLAAVEPLSARPQLPLVSRAASVREQAQSGRGTDWGIDLALLASDPEDPAGARRILDAVQVAVETPALEQGRTAVSDQVAAEILSEVQAQVEQQVTLNIHQEADLPGPPGTP